MEKAGRRQKRDDPIRAEITQNRFEQKWVKGLWRKMGEGKNGGAVSDRE